MKQDNIYKNLQNFENSYFLLDSRKIIGHFIRREIDINFKNSDKQLFNGADQDSEQEFLQNFPTFSNSVPDPRNFKWIRMILIRHYAASAL